MPIFQVETDVNSFHGSQTWEVIADSAEHAAEIFNKEGGEFVREELEVMGHVDVTAADFYEVAESGIGEDAEEECIGEDHPKFEDFIRAFWRRIEPHKNNYGKELPDDLPLEFRVSMATAFVTFSLKKQR